MNGWTISSDEGIYYYYNPCFPFYKGPLYTTACIYNSTYGGYCEIGGWYTTDFSYNGVNVVAEYNGNDCGFQRTTTLVTLICDPFVESPEPTVLGRLTGSMFWLSIRSELTTEEATTFSQTTQETTEIPFPTTAHETTEIPFSTTAPETTEIPLTTSADNQSCHILRL